MNERIKQLWEQAKTSGVHPQFGEYDKYSADKFAQLIVRECVEQGKLSQSQTVVNGSEEYNSGREMGIEVFMNQIKKHFGVTE